MQNFMMPDTPQTRITDSQSKIQHDIAIFPLPIFLLPGGRQRLRIFEAKYLSMIANVTQKGGFIIARSNKRREHQVSSWGIKVSIVDFNMGEDNILEVDVEGLELVTISNLTYQTDGLLIGSALPIDHWSMLDNNEATQPLTEFLERLFDEHELIQSLYSNTAFDDPTWVCSRLIEILPISLDKKENFLSPTSFPSLVELLNEVVSGHPVE